MFWSSLSFEWRYFIKQPSFIIMATLFFLLAFLASSLEQVQLGQSYHLFINSPYVISQTLLIFQVFGVFLIVNFIANTALRAKQYNMQSLLHTRNLSHTYFLGGFLGSVLVILSIFLCALLGIFMASLMPWLPQERLTENQFVYYAVPFVFYVIPTVFFVSCLCYAAALRFRSPMAVYLSALFVLVIYLSLDSLISNPDYAQTIAVLDPFAINNFQFETQYWSTNEKNTQLTGLDQTLLFNRVLFLCLALFVLFISRKYWTTIAQLSNHNGIDKSASDFRRPIEWHTELGAGTNLLQQFAMRLLFELRLLIRSVSFIILLIFCAYLLVHQLVFPSTYYGVANWPLSAEMVQRIRESFSLIFLIILTYYSAEVLWREDNHRMSELIAVSSSPNAVFWFSKFIALCLLMFLIYVLGMLISISYQLSSLYFDIDLSLYLHTLFYFDALPYIYLTVLAFFIQSLCSNKYMGMLIFICYIILSLVLFELGIEHHMFRFASAPVMIYSEINHYAWSLETQQIYMSYWGALSLIFALLSLALWRRVPRLSNRHRFHLLGEQLGSLGRVLLVLSVVAFASLAIVIHYNTRVTNIYLSSHDLERLAYAYEIKYGQFEQEPVPDVANTELDIALFPSQRMMQVIAQLQMVNNSDKPISRFLLNLPKFSHSMSFSSERGSAMSDDSELQTAWFVFDEALQSGESFDLTIHLTRQHFGFKDANEDYSLVANGTFINNVELLPQFGVDTSVFISDAMIRNERGLPPRPALASADNAYASRQMYLSQSDQGTGFKATLSTQAEQIAIAPGKLSSYWQQNGRNYFVYESERPIVNYYTILSGDYRSASSRIGDIDATVYYHAQHHWNVDHMLNASRLALDDFQVRFGDYPFQALRIVEFPAYRRFAQSFASTIVFSEAIGFTADRRDDTQIDVISYVVAHEIAHQWFGHQLKIANVAGAGVLTESLAQYAALSLMRKQYGEASIRAYLLDELDLYLRRRGEDSRGENSLASNQNQAYLNYNKGALVFMSLSQLLGQQRLDGAIAQLLKDFPMDGNKFAKVSDLILRLKQNATKREAQTIDQLFNSMRLYDFQLIQAEVIENKDASYTVNLLIDAQAFSSSPEGALQKETMDEELLIAFYSESPDRKTRHNKILDKQTIRLGSGTHAVSLRVKEKPGYVALDPFIQFIDRSPNNNSRQLQ